MRLSKSTTNAILILIDCAQCKDELAKVGEIADRLDITQQNTFKIVHLLSRAGFLEAVRGRYGGVRLAMPASSMRIGQVVREMESRVSVSGEPSHAQRFDRLVDDALDAFIDVLDGYTLADMAANKRTLKGVSSRTGRNKKTSGKRSGPGKVAQVRSRSKSVGLRAR